MNQLTLITYTENLDQESKALGKKLKHHNDLKIGEYKKGSLLFLYRDKSDEIVAGLYAIDSLGKFYIDFLWVDDHYRDQGLGSKLLKMAEDHAKKANNLYIRLNTGSFQAPDFYRKHGYEEFAKLPLKTRKLGIQYDYYFIKYLDKSIREENK